MYTFQWEAVLTRDTLRRVVAAAGVKRHSRLPSLRQVLGQILEVTGGLPVVVQVPNAAQRTAMALGLIHDAVRHTLATIGAAGRSLQTSRGCVLFRSTVTELGVMATAIDRVPVNRASVDAIRHATGVSSSVAERIVAERRAHGPFHTIEELDKRTRGVDARNRDRIATAVYFDDPTEQLSVQVEIVNDFDKDLGRLVALQDGATAEERLSTALETVASISAAGPHPATNARRARSNPVTLPSPATEAKWVGILASTDYYDSLLRLLASARKSIDVCIFHIAAPGGNHPTRKLLNALAAAKRRRVKVRVLMDRDRPSDPYKSTIINSPAKKLLEKARIAVRLDPEDRLLHSKFIVIDNELAVIGSHNWSAGSYFGFDDLSLVISSKELAGDLARRFTRLWGT